MIKVFYRLNRRTFLFFVNIKVILLLFLVFQLPGFLYADTEYTQYMSYDDISAAGTEPDPSDEHWSDSLAHIISENNGLYRQGSHVNGDCYLQFDLSIRRAVNCFKIYFYQQAKCRYRFKIAYNNTTTNLDGIYYTARTIGWSTRVRFYFGFFFQKPLTLYIYVKRIYPISNSHPSTQSSEDTFISYYLDGTFSQRYWRIYFYGNDTGDIDYSLAGVDEWQNTSPGII